MSCSLLGTELGLPIKSDDIDGNKIIRIQDHEYLLAYNKQMRNKDILLDGYFEDYTFYYKHIDHIKTWFKIPEKNNNKDLVFHLRTGDRLFYKAHYDSKGNPLVSIDKIENALINKNSQDYNKYLNLSKTKIISNLSNTYDLYLNNKYKL